MFWQSFDKIVAKYPKRIAFTSIVGDDEKKYSYTELKNLIIKFQGYFVKNKISPGDTILCLLPNSVEMLTLLLACMKHGANFSPLPCNIVKDDFLEVYKNLDTKYVFFSDEINENLKKIISKKNSQKIGINDLSWIKNKSKKSFKLSKNTKPKIFLKTSGTTGDPKMMIIDANTLWKSGKQFIGTFNLKEQQTYWNFLPMSYLGGIFNLGLIPLSVGGNIIIDENFSGKTFLNFWNRVKQYKINVLWLVPTIVNGLIKIHNKRDLYSKNYKTIKLCLIGTAPISSSQKKKFFDKFKIKLIENFALSETTFISSDEKNQKNFLEDCKGKILKYIEVKIKKIKKAKFGEILVKTKFLFDGYLDLKTSKIIKFNKNKFFNTGDIGYINRSKLFVVGRKKEIIKKGGILINLREIEKKLLNKISNINEVVAIKTKHSFYGESYNLKIVLKSKFKQNEIINSKIYESLQREHFPEKIIFVKKIDKTLTGKIKKF